jgi:cytochrome P450
VTEPGDIEATAQAVSREMEPYRRLAARRRRTPRNDLISELVDAEIDGERVSEPELLALYFLLLNAGNDVTRNAISGGMLALIEHPDQRARLRTDPALLSSAVEEILRWTSPVLHMMRTATRAVEIRGQAIRAGERVVMWYPSANRDEDVFPEPDRFDVSREPNAHLAHGSGEHFCLGTGLARLELTVLFEELLRRLPDLELAGQPEPLRSNFVGGFQSMPVRFTRQPRS